MDVRLWDRSELTEVIRADESGVTRACQLADAAKTKIPVGHVLRVSSELGIGSW